MKEFLTALLEEYIVTVNGETYIPVPQIPLIVKDLCLYIEGVIMISKRDTILEAYSKRLDEPPWTIT